MILDEFRLMKRCMRDGVISPDTAAQILLHNLMMECCNLVEISGASRQADLFRAINFLRGAIDHLSIVCPSKRDI